MAGCLNPDHMMTVCLSFEMKGLLFRIVLTGHRNGYLLK